MKVAICAVTLGRAEYMEMTWENNLKNAGCEYDLFWIDNGTNDEEFHLVAEIAQRYDITWFEHRTENTGIAPAYNTLIKTAHEMGYDYVMTMANDIVEPDNWLINRIIAAEQIENTGIVAIPCNGAHRYSREKHGDIEIEIGQIIGNYLITRQAIETIGYWNNAYGIYGPIDLDYCDRLRAVGLKAYYLSNEHSKHIGVWSDMPSDYQKKKKESLNNSWQKYTYAKERYSRGEGLYIPWAE